ncbi:MAG: hypothetical protein ABSA76_03260 [Bacteroidales bacterium]
MKIDNNIPEPFQFNPVKHHLPFIKEFISCRLSEDRTLDISLLVRELKHIGTSVMDVYNGPLQVNEILNEVAIFLKSKHLDNEMIYSEWTGRNYDDFRIIELSDTSQWMLKYHKSKDRYVHLFPARTSPHSFRVKANTLKSATLYNIVIGKDYISRKDLNRARAMLGLSPVKDPADAEAITEMIEILRS